MRKIVKPALIIVAVVVAIAATVIGSSYLANHLNKKADDANQACKTGQHASHTVTIKDGQVSPANTNGKLCDTLTITNLDDSTRLLAFGRHEQHVEYDGVSERALNKNQSLSVTLVETGNYKFHDHLHDEVQGTFTVAAPKPAN